MKELLIKSKSIVELLNEIFPPKDVTKTLYSYGKRIIHSIVNVRYHFSALVDKNNNKIKIICDDWWYLEDALKTLYLLKEIHENITIEYQHNTFLISKKFDIPHITKKRLDIGIQYNGNTSQWI